MMSEERESTELVASLTGVALAGGLSRRMGQDKAALDLAGQPLLARVVGRLERVCARVIVIGPRRLQALAPSVAIYPDSRPHLGPLGGLATALPLVATPWVFLAGCDMPFIQPALVRHMASLALASPNAQAVALVGPRGLEPLHALYRRDIGALVDDALAGERASMTSLLARMRVIEVAPEDMARLDPDALSTFNANTPDEWRRAQELAARELDG